MIFRFLFIFLLTPLWDCYAQVDPWILPTFQINGDAPRVMWSDTIDKSLYIGGNIHTVNNKSVNRVFRIDSSGFIDRLDTVTPATDPPLSIGRYKDSIYFAGYNGLFTLSNGKWHPKIGYSHGFFTMLEYQGGLLLGGLFVNATTSYDGALIKYDGTTFSQFNRIDTVLNVLESSVIALAEYKGKLYIAGNFRDKYNEIMSWDGTAWDNLLGGISGSFGSDQISDLVVYKNELYVGGIFQTATGAMSNNILKWDGSRWLSIGEGIYGDGVIDMLVFEDELWVVGSFDSVPGMKIDNIVKWNGIEWCRPSGEFDRQINYIEGHRDTLYVCGNFREISGDPLKKFIVKLNPLAEFECKTIETTIDEFISFTDVQIHPNPASSMIYIDSPKPDNLVKFRIIDISGQIVQSGVTFNSQINISNISAGMFLLELTFDNNTVRKKVLISR